MTKEELNRYVKQAGTKELTDAERAHLPGSFITLPCGNTHYEMQGEGTPVVLVPGYATPYYIYNKVFDALVAAGFQVLRYDLLGRGLSERVNAVYNPALFARQLKELTDALLPDTPFLLIGTSMGGAVTATFCATDPGRAKAVAWLAPAGMDTFAPPFYMKLANTPVIGTAVFHLIANKTLLSKCASEMTHVSQNEIDDFMRAFGDCIVYRDFVRCTLSSLRNTILAAKDVTKSYEAVAAQGLPVLCIWGEADKTMPFYQSERFRQVLPNAQFVPFSGSGHVFLFDEAERTMDVLLPFLKQWENAGQ
ncbi:MAG: alpha/beta hydrolase [Clostridia bacterium]|nr:alpha/beta hydrolase [Clostridia bacterium]